MKKTIKLIILMAFMIIAFSAFYAVDAASASISASKTSANVGDSVTIYVSYNAAAWNLSVTGSGISGTKYVGNTDDAENASYSKSLSLNTSSAGTYTIYLKGDVSDGSTGVTSNINKSVTVTVKPKSSSEGSSSTGNNSGGISNSSGGSNTNKPSNSSSTPTETTKSSDSSLKGLSVTEGAITPEFNKDVKEYSLNVPYDVTAVNVIGIVNDSKATVGVTGNTDLQEGENIVTVSVNAEDGSVTKYIIKVTRGRAALSLQSLVVKYENEKGELIDLLLNPTFTSNVNEYTLEDLEYWIEKLKIEAIANIEGATIDIQGADNLKEGENVITITLKLSESNDNLPEGEEPKEETITYTIKFNRKSAPIPPTFMEKFNEWYNQNQEQVILGALGICIVTLLGLSVYIVVDHNKYKDIIREYKKSSEVDMPQEIDDNIIEKIHENIKSEDLKQTTEEDNKKNNKPKGGRHF